MSTSLNSVHDARVECFHFDEPSRLLVLSLRTDAGVHLQLQVTRIVELAVRRMRAGCILFELREMGSDALPEWSMLQLLGFETGAVDWEATWKKSSFPAQRALLIESSYGAEVACILSVSSIVTLLG